MGNEAKYRKLFFNSDELNLLLQELKEILVSQKKTLGVAESCTGGLLCAVCTEISGSSSWFTGGIVAYDCRLKKNVLGVQEDILTEYGAVSEQCVISMCNGVCNLFNTSLGVSISGIAGPSGGSVEKPIGTVWIAWKNDNACFAKRFLFCGNRNAVRIQAVYQALIGLRKIL